MAKTEKKAQSAAIAAPVECDENKNYVITTTASNSCYYAVYRKLENGVNSLEAKVLIKGGANVANKKSGEAAEKFETILPGSTVNSLLLSNAAFRRKVEKGYIAISTRSVKTSSLEAKDASAQKVDKDFEESGGATPKKGGE